MDTAVAAQTTLNRIAGPDGPRPGPVRPAGTGPWVRRIRRTLSPLALLALWQVGSSTGFIRPQTLSSPATVWTTAVDLVQRGQLQEHLWVSVGRTGKGLALGVALGTVFAVIAGLSRLGEDLVDPPLQILRTLPILALVPLFIVWFGIGETPKVLMIGLGCAFPVYLNTYAGIRGVDDRLVEVASTVGLSRWRLLRDVILPGSLPSFLVGLRYAMGISWLVLVVSEQVNANSGIGWLMADARLFGKTDVMVLGLVIYGLLGLTSDLVVRALEGRTLRWRAAFTGR